MKLENKKNILKKIFSDILKKDFSQINNSLSMNDMKEWDSMTHVRIIIEVEKKFKIKINFQKAEKMRTFKEFLDFLESK